MFAEGLGEVMRGGAEVARLAHNQQVEGSSPSPASSLIGASVALGEMLLREDEMKTTRSVRAKVAAKVYKEPKEGTLARANERLDVHSLYLEALMCRVDALEKGKVFKVRAKR